MEKYESSNKWLPLAIAAAIALTNPFMIFAIGFSLGFLFLCCDKRPSFRKSAAFLLLLMSAAAAWADPITTLFTVVTALIGIYSLRKNLFSTVTSSALIGCLLATSVTVPVIWTVGREEWRKIEQSTVTMQERWERLISGAQTKESERNQALQKWNRLTVKLLPSQFILMTIASFFLAVILYRRHGRSDLPLSLGCSHFYQYRFEDNWVWMVVLGLVLAIMFSSYEWVTGVAVNVLFVMGTLYIIRGLAVMFYFIAAKNGGLLLRFLVVALCVTPMVLLHLIFGLLDTWVDFRKTVPLA